MNSALSGKDPDVTAILHFFGRTDVILFLATLFLRLLALPFAEGVDADDVSRVLFSFEWLQHPYFIMCEVWPSLHYYLIALFIWIFNDHVAAPLFINIIIGALTTPVLYHFTRRLYNREGAMFAVIIYLFVPVFFRLNLEVMSETPFLLLLALTMLYLLKGIRGEISQLRAGLIAGLCLALSSGFRLEGWLLTPLLLFVVTVQRKYLLSVSFLVASASYPLFWMATCYMATGDPLFSIHRSAEWNHHAAGINDLATGMVKIQRLLIQPMTMLLMLSPWLIGLLLFSLYANFRRGALSLSQWIWLFPFVSLLCLYEYKTYMGDMNVHPRYSATLMLILIPHFGAASTAIKGKCVAVFIVCSAFINSVASFYYVDLPIESPFRFHEKYHEAVSTMKHHQFHKEQAVPILRDRRILEYESNLFAHLSDGKGLILDFLDWESTYHMMLHSGLQRKHLLVLIGDVLKNTYSNHMLMSFLNDHPSGVLMLKKNSGVYKNSSIMKDDETILLDNTSLLHVAQIFESDEVLIFSYEMTPSPFRR